MNRCNTHCHPVVRAEQLRDRKKRSLFLLQSDPYLVTPDLVTPRFSDRINFPRYRKLTVFDPDLVTKTLSPEDVTKSGSDCIRIAKERTDAERRAILCMGSCRSFMKDAKRWLELGMHGEVDYLMWDEIRGEIKQGKVKAFLLSESSLFVWDDQLLLKTCGTTTPLSLLHSLDKAGLQSVVYQHGAFLRPSEQQDGYRTFTEIEKEVKDLVRLFNSPINMIQPTMFADGSLEFNASLNHKSAQFIDLKLSNLFPDSLYNTASSQDHISSLFRSIFNRSGKWTVDLYHFEPCGFSLNAVDNTGEKYATVHVTPEHKFSYASFETNDIDLLMWEVEFIVRIFEPRNMDVSMSWPDKSVKKKFLRNIMRVMDLVIPGQRGGGKTNLYQFIKKM
eukprot:sb/3465527/